MQSSWSRLRGSQNVPVTEAAAPPALALLAQESGSHSPRRTCGKRFEIPKPRPDQTIGQDLSWLPSPCDQLDCFTHAPSIGRLLEGPRPISGKTDSSFEEIFRFRWPTSAPLSENLFKPGLHIPESGHQRIITSTRLSAR